MRGDEEKKCCSLLAIAIKARAVVGRGEKSLLSDAVPEERTSTDGGGGGGETETKSAKKTPGKWDEQKNKTKTGTMFFHVYSRLHEHSYHIPS